LENTTAILQFICPDRPGLVSELTGWVAENGGNINHSDHHTDIEAGLFISRIEWTLNKFIIDRDMIFKEIHALTKSKKGKSTLCFSDEVPRVAIFASKQNHCLLDLLWRVKSDEIKMTVPLVISNHEELKDVCEYFDVDFLYVPYSQSTRENSEKTILRTLKRYNIELGILAKYMQVLSPQFLKEFSTLINIHHSFLPAFKGSKPYHQAWNRGVKLIGATAHYVTQDLDDGPIIAQTISQISHRDDVEDLIRKGRDLERVALSRAVRLHLRKQVIVYGSRTVVFD